MLFLECDFSILPSFSPGWCLETRSHGKTGHLDNVNDQILDLFSREIFFDDVFLSFKSSGGLLAFIFV